MKILNLTSLEKSDIKFKISKFPDGQQQITIEEFDTIKREFHKIRRHNYINIIEN